MNFFVPLLNEDLSLEENIRNRDFRLHNFQEIMKEQFQLTYFGKVEYTASEHMSVMERHTIYKILVDQIELEKKQQEEAIRNMKNKQHSSTWRRKR